MLSTSHARGALALALAALLALAACDQDPVGSVDQGRKDQTTLDAGSDTVQPDLPAPDTRPPDQRPPDQAAPDLRPSDQRPPDVQPPDHAVPDRPAPDLQPPDLQQPDQAIPDLLQPDQPVPDLQQPDQLVPDLLQPDLLPPDQAVPDLPAPTCTDALHNGDETDVDCGGASCPKCADNKQCKVAGDCINGVCHGGICQPPGLTIKAGQTVYFEDLAARAQVSAITGAVITVVQASVKGTLKAGDEVLLINMQGTVKDAASVGNYELLEIKSISGVDVTLTATPTKAYGAGGANTSLAGHKVFLVQVPRHGTLSIEGTLAARPWTGTTAGLGLVLLRATVKLVLAAGGKISASDAGYRSAGYTCNGVTGRAGESLAPMVTGNTGKCSHPAPTNKPNFGGGGGGLSNCNVYSCATQLIGAGGAGASYATAGVAGKANGSKQKGGLPGLLYGQTSLQRLYLGSGGGAGAGGYSGPGSGTSGGHGGGLIYLMGPTLQVAGSITANGKIGGINGSCSITHGSGSGGGGSGGSIYLRGKAVTLPAAKTVTALGAAGGCKGGGSGGAGRVRVDYNTLNGAAYPNGTAALTSPSAYLAEHK